VRSDIQQYLEMYRPEAAAVAYEFPIVVVANGQNDQVESADELASELDIEGDLDGELVLGISWPTTFMSWVTGGSPPFNPDLNTPTDTNEPYLVWLSYVLAQSTLPQVISSK
jgi:tripeptidyl-peptidase-1